MNEIIVPTTLPRYLLVPVQCLHLYLLVVMVSNIIFLKIKFPDSGSGTTIQGVAAEAEVIEITVPTTLPLYLLQGIS